LIHVLANALTPIFVGLLLGYLAGLWRMIDNRHVESLMSFVMSFAIPCSLFLAVAVTPFERLRGEAATALVLAMTFAVTYALSFLWSRKGRHLNVSDSSVVALTLAFPNAAAVGLPLLGSVFGSAAKVTVATSLAIGSITVSPMTLFILETTKGEAGDLALNKMMRPILHAIRKPVVWAPALGFLVSVLDITLPAFVRQTFGTLGSAADGAALVLTGLVVSAQRFSVAPSTLVAAFFKNILQPVLCLGFATLIGLPLVETRYVTLISAMPCGFFGLVFGQRIDVTPILASSGLIVSYVLAIATLTAWILILKSPGIL
jgi:malonate transporter and related proteins